MDSKVKLATRVLLGELSKTQDALALLSRYCDVLTDQVANLVAERPIDISAFDELGRGIDPASFAEIADTMALAIKVLTQQRTKTRHK